MTEETPVPAAAGATFTGGETSGRPLLEVSNAVVRIHKQYYGKGPVKARALLTQDVLVVTLEGGLTRHEETLLEHGHTQEVAQGRAALRQAIEPALRSAVEEITHRSVRAFMSANDPAARVAAEIFVLGPSPSAGAA